MTTPKPGTVITQTILNEDGTRTVITQRVLKVSTVPPAPAEAATAEPAAEPTAEPAAEPTAQPAAETPTAPPPEADQFVG
jgi:hypothetical protein